MPIKIASIIHTLNTEWGGPVKAILDQNIYFHQKKYLAKIIVLDNKNTISKYFLNKISITYLGRSFLAKINFLGINKFNINFSFFFWLIKNRNKFDIFILHGIWDFKNIIARLIIKKKYYVFIHGNLDPYEWKNFFKGTKKRIYWFLVEKINLINAKAILFTNKVEKKLADKTFVNTSGIKSIIVNYGIVVPKCNNIICSRAFFKTYLFLKNKEYYLFMGRIDKKKGCDIAIRCFKSLGNNFKSNLVVVGDYNNETGEKLKKLLLALGLKHKVFFLGHLIDDLKFGAIINSKAMVLPSYSENFGISLMESLAFGKPVLTTFKVNTYQTILDYNAGYITNTNLNSFANIIKKFENLGKERKLKMSKNAKNCFEEKFNLLNKKSFIKEFDNINQKN